MSQSVTGESVPSLSVLATVSNRAHAASGHNIPEHPPPEYGLTLRPSRSTGTQNGRNLPPCRRMANHDRSARFNMTKWSGNARLSQRGHSRPFLNQSFESVSNLPWARPTISTAAGIETSCEPPTRKNEADRQRSPCSRGRYRSCMQGCYQLPYPPYADSPQQSRTQYAE